MLEMTLDVLMEIHQPVGVSNEMRKDSQSEVPDGCSTTRSRFMQVLFAQFHMT